MFSELRKAESFIRHGVRGPEAVALADRLMAEYDRRGEVEQRARALLDALSSDEGYDRGFNGEAVERAVQDLARALRGEAVR